MLLSPEEYANRLSHNQIAAYFSKNIVNRCRFVKQFAKNKNITDIVYICPKKYIDEVRELLECDIYAFEDVSNKTNAPFNYADTSNKLLVYDGSARYKSVMSNTFIRLEKLALLYTYKLCVDNVPFINSVEYIYIPYCHIGRHILGHQHYYAFRENYLELDENGKQVRGHDFTHLSKKIAPYTEIDYAHYLPENIETCIAKMTAEESCQYQKLRNELFETYQVVSPIITTLADFINIRESRYKLLDEVLKTLTGNIIIYSNLQSHCKPLRKRFPGPSVFSYYDKNGMEEEADYIILFESPIVKNYLLLDVIARLKPSCRMILIRSDAPVDIFLYNRMIDEFKEIDAFIKKLYEVKNGR